MGIAGLKNFARSAALLVAVAGLTPGTASASWSPASRREEFNEWAGYAVPIQDVDQFPAAIVWQPTASFGYAVPIRSAYQFPAAQVNQPGVQLLLAPPRPLYISSGDHHVINR